MGEHKWTGSLCYAERPFLMCYLSFTLLNFLTPS